MNAGVPDFSTAIAVLGTVAVRWYKAPAPFAVLAGGALAAAAWGLGLAVAPSQLGA